MCVFGGEGGTEVGADSNAHFQLVSPGTIKGNKKYYEYN
jgi:hypothetical protein